MRPTEKQERGRRTERDLNVTVTEVLGRRNVAARGTRSLLPHRWGRSPPALDRAFLVTVTAPKFPAEAPSMHAAGHPSGLDFLVHSERFPVFPWASPTTCRRYRPIVATARVTL